MSTHSIVVFCARPKKEKKDHLLAVTPQGNTPHPHGPKKAMVVVEREDRDSTRTKAGNPHVKSSKEPDSTDDAFKDLAARLAKKEKPDKTNDSLLGGDDENPLAQLQMPERPVVRPNEDGAKLENIVDLEKKPGNGKPQNKTPTGPPITAKDVSIAVPLPEERKSKKSLKGAPGAAKSKLESPVHTDKTQSDPRKDVDPTQNFTLEDDNKDQKKKEEGSQKSKNQSVSAKTKKKEKSNESKKGDK